MPITTIIGVDCATQPEHTGVARAVYDGSRMTIQQAVLGSRDNPPQRIIDSWLNGASSALLALDAPLGWPRPLAPELLDHRAGTRLVATPNAMFRRLTDDAIYERLGKRSLDVGADRIARTAHAALTLLENIRRTLDEPVDLAWEPTWRQRIAAIEVYPAATRVAHGSQTQTLPDWFANPPDGISIECPIPESRDAQDAIVCAIAAFDFLNGVAVPPTPDQRHTAIHEGWIWAARQAP